MVIVVFILAIIVHIRVVLLISSRITKFRLSSTLIR